MPPRTGAAPTTLDASALRAGPASLTAELLGAVVFAGLAAILAFAPLAFGAVEPWSVSILEGSAAVLLCLWLCRRLFLGDLHFSLPPAHAAMLAMVGVVALQVLFHATAYWFASYTSLLQYLAYAALFLVTADLLRSETRLQKFALFAATFGFVVALFAILQDFTSNGALYWLRVPRFSSPIFGPYVNRNHYAGLMEMLVPFPLLLAASRELDGGKRALLAFIAVIMGTSIFLSQSRGGMLAFLAELLFLAAVGVARKQGRKAAVGVGVVFVLMISLLLWMEATHVFARFLGTSPGEELRIGRLAIIRDGLRMVPRHPLLGWGAGTFATTFPQFRTFYDNTVVNAAHNDLLQMLIETGVLGLGSFLALVTFVYRQGLKSVRRVRLSASIAVRLAAVTACTGMLVHSMLDFNLQIPANAAWFFVVCAVAVSRSGGGSRPAKVLNFRQVED